jgi:phosphoglycerol transferase MdoB-like AlkP superfamily enzyme
VDTIGGGTANTEFMALTRCSMRYLSGYPYQNLIKRDINSIAREMSGLGYKTLAHHPHLKSNYNRIFVYPKFGFDIFTGIDEAGYDMDQDVYRVFVSDEADFRYIEGLIGNENGKTFSRLFEIRHSGDYDDFVYCDKAMIDEYTPKAKEFINAIKTLLGK